MPEFTDETKLILTPEQLADSKAEAKSHSDIEDQILYRLRTMPCFDERARRIAVTEIESAFRTSRYAAYHGTRSTD